MSEYGLIIAFPDGSDSFVHGYEAGQVHAKLESEPEEVSGTWHASNEELFRRMAAHFGYELETEPTEYSEWISVRFLRMARRGGLRVVK